MRLYVGNLARTVEQTDLEEAFGAFGTVTQVNIITDRTNGAPKGFAFVEMPNDAEAKNAIAGLHRTDMKGRSLDINEARPKTERSSRPGGRRSY